MKSDQISAKHRVAGFWAGGLSGVAWGFDIFLLGIVLGASTLSIDAIRGPILVTALHDAISFGLLLGLLLLKGRLRALLDAIKTSAGRMVALGAVCGGPIGMTAFFLAISRIGAGRAAVITAMYPAVGALLAWIFLRDRLNRIGVVGLFLAIVGSGLVGLLSNASDSAFDWLGFGFALICTVAWSAEVVICAYGMKADCAPDIAVTIRQATSTLVYAMIVLPLSGTYAVLGDVGNLNKWLIIAAIAGGFSYKLYYASIATIGPTRAMGLNISYSAWAVLLGLVFGVSQSWQLLLLSLLVVVGSMLTAADFLPLVMVWVRQLFAKLKGQC